MERDRTATCLSLHRIVHGRKRFQPSRCIQKLTSQAEHRRALVLKSVAKVVHVTLLLGHSICTTAREATTDSHKERGTTKEKGRGKTREYLEIVDAFPVHLLSRQGHHQLATSSTSIERFRSRTDSLFLEFPELLGVVFQVVYQRLIPSVLLRDQLLWRPQQVIHQTSAVNRSTQ